MRPTMNVFHFPHVVHTTSRVWALGLGLSLSTALMPSLGHAGPGHDHDEPANLAAQAMTPSAPRFEAVAPPFELVGVLDGRRLTLYLDQHADNRPLSADEAPLTITLAGQAVPLQATESGTYEAFLPSVLEPGTHAVMATIGSGALSASGTTLRTQFVVNDDHDSTGAGDDPHHHLTEWLAGALALLVLIAGIVVWRRRRAHAGTGSASAGHLMFLLPGLVALTLMLAPYHSAQAGPGHHHEEAAPGRTVAHPMAPQRQADGQVIVPKATQRQWSLRTTTVTRADHARTQTLPGAVVMDPNAGGVVQAMQAGRIEPGPQGLPSLGQAVRQGQVLAYVRPSSAALERSNQRAQLAELQTARTLAAQQLARLQQLSDTVPAKDIDAARLTLQSLDRQATAVRQGLDERETLIAPVTGVIASSWAVGGQVVDARERLFEIVNPQRLRIEALAYDPRMAEQVASASITIGGQAVPLRFIGAGRSLREQALPLLFAANGSALSALAVGQALTVWVQSNERIGGYRVPATSLLKTATNQPMVWVKTSAERFEPRMVMSQALDGAHVLITSGLRDGERVVVQAANLLQQIR